MPPLDAQQDWNLVDSSEQNGVTTLKFYRQRNTSDANDVAIEVNSASQMSGYQKGDEGIYTFRG